MVIDEQPEKLKEGVHDEHLVRLKDVLFSVVNTDGA